jgi:uncharacterized protein (DUF2236 family)
MQSGAVTAFTPAPRAQNPAAREGLSASACEFLPLSDTSMVRRVHREGVLLLGGGRALLMQIAHPLVARGVAEHSNFRTDRLDRLLRTLRPMLTIVFGTREQALAAAASINHVHQHVTGRGYAAKDPELLLWVLATLIDTSLYMHEWFVRPLSPDEQSIYYDDMCRVGSLLGIPVEDMPPDVSALAAYVERLCNSLIVTEDARDIAAALFRSDLLTWPVLGSVRLLTAALLPAPLRAQFGLAWGVRRETAFGAFAASSRLLLPHLPRRLTAPPWFLMPPRDLRPCVEMEDA